MAQPGCLSNIKSALHRNYSSLSSLTLRSLRSLRLNHADATGIDITEDTAMPFPYPKIIVGAVPRVRPLLFPIAFLHPQSTKIQRIDINS